MQVAMCSRMESSAAARSTSIASSSGRVPGSCLPVERRPQRIGRIGSACRVGSQQRFATRAQSSAFDNPAIYESQDSFAEARYWDKRYIDEKGRAFEWYRDFSSLETLVKQHVPLDSRILQVGFGTSRIQYEMYLAGYQSIHNVDFSQVAVDTMSTRDAAVPALSYAFADCRSMPEYADGSYDCVLDKGTLDALLCGEDDERDVGRMLQEVWRILRPGGTYVMITYSPPKVRLRYAALLLQQQQQQQQQQQSRWSRAEFYEVGQQGLRDGPLAVDLSAPEMQLVQGSVTGVDLGGVGVMGSGSNGSAEGTLEGLSLGAYPRMIYSHFFYVLTKITGTSDAEPLLDPA